jgi:hypothetical protein
VQWRTSTAAGLDNGEGVRQWQWPMGIQSNNGKATTFDSGGGGDGSSGNSDIDSSVEATVTATAKVTVRTKTMATAMTTTTAMETVTATGIKLKGSWGRRSMAMAGEVTQHGRAHSYSWLITIVSLRSKESEE